MITHRLKQTALVLLYAFSILSCAPDLIVRNVSHTPACPKTSDNITFTAQVENAGNRPAGASVLSFRIGGESSPPTYPVPALAPGASYTVTRQLVLGTAQPYTNTVIADINNSVAETNEANNQGVEHYSVGCCIPPYAPAYWNNNATIRSHNNCYNYGNNKRTDTFAQPGRAAGAQYTKPITCQKVIQAALADGLVQLPSSGNCPSAKDKIALVVAPCVAPGCTSPFYSGNDYHWYRQDENGMWSHKPGGTPAKNLDNSGNPIPNPETANRCSPSLCYSQFCGYFCSCSDSAQGQGHETIQ